MTVISGRRFTVTLNNPTEIETTTIKEHLLGSDNIKYAIIGSEIAPTTGTPHLQGFVSYKSTKTLKTLKKVFSDRAHFENAIADDETNRTYCSKESVLIEIGTPQTKGKRNDISGLKAKLLSDDVSKQSLYLEYPQYIRLIDKMTDFEKGRTVKPNVVWIYGPSGSGKSRYAQQLAIATGQDIYTKTCNNKWFNGYDGQPVLIMNDLRAGTFEFNEMLNMLDRYEHRVETKGGMRQLVSTTILITTNRHPAKIYKSTNENMTQVLRRIDSLIKIDYKTMDTKTGYNPASKVYKIETTVPNPYDDIMEMAKDMVNESTNNIELGDESDESDDESINPLDQL